MSPGPSLALAAGITEPFCKQGFSRPSMVSEIECESRAPSLPAASAALRSPIRFYQWKIWSERTPLHTESLLGEQILDTPSFLCVWKVSPLISVCLHHWANVLPFSTIVATGLDIVVACERLCAGRSGWKTERQRKSSKQGNTVVVEHFYKPT